MTDLKELWDRELNRRVADTIVASDSEPASWRTVGRATKDKPHGEDLAWWQEDGLRQLQGYEAWLSSTDLKFLSFDGTPGIEFPFYVELAGIPVRGFIDAIMVDPDGQVITIDHKTGSRTPDSLAQLGLYATALEVMGYPRPALGAFWMTKKGEMTSPESLDRFSVEYFTQTFSSFKKAVDEDIFIPNPGSHCRGCSVRSACYIGGGADAWKFDPLHPQYQSQDTHN